MLRIDETSKTLVAPEQAALVAEPALDRAELLALLTSGWAAFAAEIGHPHLRLVAAGPVEGADVLAFDAGAGHVAVVHVVDDEDAVAALGRALAAAGEVASWDAARLAEVHADLQAAVPGDSPRIVLVGDDFPPAAVRALDWLTRRHGLELTAYVVRMLRFGGERLLDVSRAYPVPEAPAPAPAADFFAAVTGATHSAPPPGVPA
jgi:hypothetical protein